MIPPPLPIPLIQNPVIPSPPPPIPNQKRDEVGIQAQKDQVQGLIHSPTVFFLMSHRVLVLLAPGFEEIEAVTPIDLLRRADAQVIVASTESQLLVTGRSGISTQADLTLPEVIDQDFDLLVLPGGPAVFDLREKPRILDLIRRLHFANVPIGAICAAPFLLHDAGILKDADRYTAHGSTAEELPDLISDSSTIVSGI